MYISRNPNKISNFLASCASCQQHNWITKWPFRLQTKTKRSNESTFFINEALEQQRPSGYQNSPQAIVWMRTMTQQEGDEQRSAELQARSPAGPDNWHASSTREHTHTNTHKYVHVNRWLNGPLKLLSIHLWIILIISKKVMILISGVWLRVFMCLTDAYLSMQHIACL